MGLGYRPPLDAEVIEFLREVASSLLGREVGEERMADVTRELRTKRLLGDEHHDHPPGDPCWRGCPAQR